MGKIIAFANPKGGVGKTTSAVNIAASLGLQGYKVLLIDLDPQGNSTSGVGVRKKSLEKTTRELLLGEVTAEEAIVETEFENLSVIPCTILVAHGFGRLGCLMAGCCHGARTDAWYGVETIYPGSRVVPVQLFEALFLCALTGVLLVLMKRGLRHQMPAYMLNYGAWRFLIEYARADDRGETIVRFLSPSQLFALLLMLGGVALLCVELYLDRRACAQGGDHA